MGLCTTHEAPLRVLGSASARFVPERAVQTPVVDIGARNTATESSVSPCPRGDSANKRTRRVGVGRLQRLSSGTYGGSERVRPRCDALPTAAHSHRGRSDHDGCWPSAEKRCGGEDRSTDSGQPRGRPETGRVDRWRLLHYPALGPRRPKHHLNHMSPFVLPSFWSIRVQCTDRDIHNDQPMPMSATCIPTPRCPSSTP